MADTEDKKSGKMDVDTAKEYLSLFKDLADVTNGYTSQMIIVGSNIKEQVVNMREHFEIAKKSGDLSTQEIKNAQYILGQADQLNDRGKTHQRIVEDLVKQYKELNFGRLKDQVDNIQKAMGPAANQFKSIISGTMDVTKAFTVGGAANVAAGIGAVVELAFSLNEQLALISKNALAAGGALGLMALKQKPEDFASGGGIRADYMAATKSLTFTYGKEQTQQMLGAAAGIGITPAQTTAVEYVGAAAKVLGVSLDAAAKLIAGIAVKTGQGIEASATVFRHLGDDFASVRTSIKTSFGEYVTQVISLYDQTRLYGGSLSEATAVTVTFAKELQSGTLSMANLTKVLTLGGGPQGVQQSTQAIGWLAALGTRVGGTTTGGMKNIAEVPVAGMNPIAQAMAIFTDPKVQQSLIQQVMGASQRFGGLMGGAGGGVENKLMGQYFQREMIQQIFGVSLGSAEWKTFQETVIPKMAQGVPIDKAMAQAGIKSQEDTLKEYVANWHEWSATSLSWQDRIESFLQIISTTLLSFSGAFLSAVELAGMLFPGAAAAMTKPFIAQAENIVGDVQGLATKGLLTPADWENASKRLDQLEEAAPTTVATLLTKYRLDLLRLHPTPSSSVMADYNAELSGATNYDPYAVDNTAPQFQFGGIVPETAMYGLHKGEEVISTTGAGVGSSVNVNISIGRLDDYAIDTIGELAKQRVMDELRKQKINEPIFGV